MIVELFGLPGAGKTYVINTIRGNCTIGVESKNRFKKFFINIIKSFSLFTPESLKLKRDIHGLLKLDSSEPLFISTSIEKHLNNIALVIFGYSHSTRSKLFLDEGIIHRVVSFAVNYNLELDVVLKITDIVIPYLKLVNCFYLDCDVQECFSSIKSRNRHFCEMDELDDTKLIAFLSAYKVYFNAIQEKYHFPVITRENISELEKIIK